MKSEAMRNKSRAMRRSRRDWQGARAAARTWARVAREAAAERWECSGARVGELESRVRLARKFRPVRPRKVAAARPLVAVGARAAADRTLTAIQLRVEAWAGTWLGGAGPVASGPVAIGYGATAREIRRDGATAYRRRERALVDLLSWESVALRWLDSVERMGRGLCGRSAGVSDESRREAGLAARAAVLVELGREGCDAMRAACWLAELERARAACAPCVRRLTARRGGGGPLFADRPAAAVRRVAAAAAVRSLRTGERVGISGTEADLTTLRRHDWEHVMGTGSARIVGKDAVKLSALVPLLCDVAGRAWGQATGPAFGERLAKGRAIRAKLAAAAAAAEATARREAAAKWAEAGGGVAARAAGRAAAAVRARFARLSGFTVALAIGRTVGEAAAAAGWSLESREGRGVDCPAARRAANELGGGVA